MSATGKKRVTPLAQLIVDSEEGRRLDI